MPHEIDLLSLTVLIMAGVAFAWVIAAATWSAIRGVYRRWRLRQMLRALARHHWSDRGEV